MITMIYLTPRSSPNSRPSAARSRGALPTSWRSSIDPAPAKARPRLSTAASSVLWFCNVINYIARALLDTGSIRPRIHPSTAESDSKGPRICGGRRVH